MTQKRTDKSGECWGWISKDRPVSTFLSWIEFPDIDDLTQGV